MKERIKQVLKLIATRLGLLKDDLRNSRAIAKYRSKIELNTDSSKCNVWVIGCGRMGKQFVKAIAQTPQFTLLGLTDKYQTAMDTLVKQFKLNDCKTTTELDDILSSFDKQKDVLIVATTANAHYSIMDWALNAGIKKIILEKPLTPSLEEGQKLIDLTQKNKALVAVDHTRRWMRGFQSLRHLLNSGIIGNIERTYFPYGEGGIAMIGSHFIDIVRYLFDQDITTVYARADKIQNANMRGDDFYDPTGTYTFELTSGLEITVDLSNQMKRKNHLMIFIGQYGRLEVDVENQDIWIILHSGKYWREKFPWAIDKQNGLISLIAEMAAGKPPKCSIEDGYKAIEGVIAAMQSIEKEQPVNLPLTGDIIQQRFQFA